MTSNKTKKFFLQKFDKKYRQQEQEPLQNAGNTKGGSITVPLTSCLTGSELAV